MDEHAYSLVESLKNEVNKFGRPGELNPIYKNLKKSVFLRKVKLVKNTSLFRARIITPSGYGAVEIKDGNDDLPSPYVANPQDKPTEPHSFSNVSANVLGEETPNEVTVETRRTVVDLDEKLKPVLGPLLFCSESAGTAVSEYRNLVVTDCILDELILEGKKKLADFSVIEDIPDASLIEHINYYFSLYLSLYLRDLNSNFYNTGRYLLEVVLQKGFDGIAYRSHFNNGINYCLFGKKDITMGGSKAMRIQQADRIDTF